MSKKPSKKRTTAAAVQKEDCTTSQRTKHKDEKNTADITDRRSVQKTAPIPENSSECAIVSEIIDENAARAKNEEYLAKIIEMKAEGFDTRYLSELLEKESPQIESEYIRIEKNIEEIRKIRETLIDIHGVEAEAKALIDALVYPEKMDEILRLKQVLDDKIKLRTLKEELSAMDVSGHEDNACRISELIEKGDVAASEKELKTLKAKIRESFFLGQVRKEAKPATTVRTGTMTRLSQSEMITKSNMTVEDIYLLHRDCRFISHHTKIVRSDEERKIVFRMLKSIRDYVRHSGKYSEGKINISDYDGRKMLIYGSGDLITGLAVRGDPAPWTQTVVSKVISMINEKYGAELHNWNGEKDALTDINKYMKVMMITFTKLESR